MPSAFARTALLAIAFAISMGTGCAQRSVQTGLTSSPATGPATWTLEQIEGAPTLPAPAVTPAEPPPLAAIELFASARAASQEGDRARAIELLRRAIAIDPNSYELHYELGTTLRQGLGFQPEALAAFERAAEIEPDRLDVQVDIARQLLADRNGPAALARLRLAILTSQYAQGQLRSAEADFLLAHALREQGYDRAALDRFELLLDRLTRGDIERSAEVARLLNHRLFMQIGDLYLKRDRTADALRAYRTAEGTLDGGSDIDLQNRIVRAMMLDGQVTAGMARAADVVRQFGASPAALALLRDVYAAVGRSDGVIPTLADLHRQHPDDRPLLFALCEVLAADGRFAEAEEKLTVAWQRSSQPSLLVRWFRLRFDRDPESAVRLLADLLADAPHVAGQIDPVWRRLTSVEGRAAMPIERLAAMKASPSTRAAQAYIVYRVAADWPRSTLAEQSLRAALAERPVFAPAFIARADELLSDTALPQAARLQGVVELATAAELAGAAGLADLLRGRVALARGDAAEATTCFVSAARRQVSWPEPQWGVVTAARASGERAAAVRQAWDVTKSFPDFTPAYSFLAEEPDADAAAVISAWTRAQVPGEPASPGIALHQAADRLAAGDTDGAALVLTDLERQSPDDPALLDLRRRIDDAANPESATTVEAARLEKLLFEAERLTPAGTTQIAARLAGCYERLGRPVDAGRVLTVAAGIAKNEPDLLCRLAASARRIGDDTSADRWLQSALELDPNHSMASEHLAALWADAGRQLDAAERLARAACDRRPDAPAIRSTLGWVLYRAGKLAEARDELLSAIRASAPIDPLLLDRAGDVLYRLGDRNAAAEYWERAQRRLGDADVATADRFDLRALRQSLPRKLRQHRTGQEVGLPMANFQSPVGDAAP